jgi:hypothetical protein
MAEQDPPQKKPPPLTFRQKVRRSLRLVAYYILAGMYARKGMKPPANLERFRNS